LVIDKQPQYRYVGENIKPGAGSVMLVACVTQTQNNKKHKQKSQKKKTTFKLSEFHGAITTPILNMLQF